METSGTGPRASAQEAAASLAAVDDSRRRARRAGFPVWFWLVTGLGLAAVPLYIVKPWLPEPWEPQIIPLASIMLLAVTAIALPLGALRGVRGCSPTPSGALREVSLFLWPFLPYVAVLLAGGIAWKNGFWYEPLAPLATAAAAFTAWAGVGMAVTTFSARR